MQKKGLSAIVTSVLIILFAIVAIAILTFVVKKSATDSLSDKNIGQYTAQFNIPLASVFVDQNAKTADLRIQRKAGQGDIQGFRIVLTDSHGSTETNRSYENTVVKELETVNVHITYILSGNITAIEVAPLFNSTNGKVVLGQPIDRIFIGSNGRPTGSTNTGGNPEQNNNPPNPPNNDTNGTNQTTYNCSDGLDNDGDGFVDFPVDPGCSSANDNDETNNNPELLFAYAWTLENNSLGNMVWFPQFGNVSWLSLNATYFKQITDAQHAKGAKSILMDWNVWGSSNNVYNKYLAGPLFTTQSDNCRYSNGSLSRFFCPWRTNGITETSNAYSRFFTNLTREGVQLDILIVDIEPALGWWSIALWPCAGLDLANPAECPEASNLTNTSREYLNVLQNDPRNESLFSLTGIRNLTIPYSNIRPYTFQFDGALVGQRNQQINQAIFNTIRGFYPSIQMNNYESSANDLISPYWGDQTYQYIPAQERIVGSHQGTQMYGPGTFNYLCLNQTSDSLYVCPGNGDYTYTPFRSFKYTLNTLRSSKLNSPAPLAPWISHKSLEGAGMRSSDLYQELLIHSALTNIDYFIAWNPRPWAVGQDPSGYASNYTDYLIDATIKEVQNLTWYSGRQTKVNSLASWKADYVLTGMTSMNRKVWRFTPNLDSANGQGIMSTIVRNNSQETVVQTTGYTLTFPNGVIYAPRNPISRQGLWIVQPSSASDPSITPR